MRLTIFASVAASLVLSACSPGVYWWHKETQPDGVYYDIACHKLRECVSFARQRCENGYELIESESANRRQLGDGRGSEQISVRCNN